MNQTLEVLVSGRSRKQIDALQPVWRELPDINVKYNLMVNGSVDPLHGVAPMPSLLIHHLSELADRELGALMEKSPQLRPTTLIVASGDDARLMRLAMQAGARDFIVGSGVVEEIVAAVRTIVREKLVESRGQYCPLTAVINAKGGAGASMVAGNLAHIMAVDFGVRTALLDFDLQFGAQALNLDLHGGQGLMEALNALESLDGTALSGYLTKHQSGLHVLTALPEQLILPGEVSVKRLEQLLNLLRQGYEHVVVDLPRMIDPVMGLLVERANNIVLIIQQNLSHVRDAKRLLRIMDEELGVRSDCIRVVVNRHDARGPLAIDDIQNALQLKSPFLIPNDFKNVSAAANLGVPIQDYAPKAPVTRALAQLAAQISGARNEAKKGMVQQWLSRLSPRA